jgi:uncharacterized protein YbjQ (UPF0145 family)
MQPTTNTAFEKFAVAAAIFLPFFVAFLFFCLGVLEIAINGPGANEDSPLGVIVVLLVLFSVFGLPLFYILSAVKIERDHLKALTQAEAELSDIVVSDMKTLPPNWKADKTFFVAENCVIANDYFKTFFWTFRKIFGGESKSFSKLVARARREATVRVLRRAKEHGANVVWNIRYETCIVQSNWAKDASKTLAGVEVLAYGTAFWVQY